MSAISVKPINLREFNASLRAVKDATKKDEADIVNRAMKDIAFRAMQFTDYAEPGKIQAELYRDNILLKMATAMLTKRAGNVRVDRFGNTKLTKSGRAKKHASNVTRSAIAQLAAKLLRIRLSSARAIRAGWIPAVKAFGGSIRGEKQKQGGSTSKGFGTKATISKLSGIISNALVTRNHLGKRTRVENIPQATQALSRAVAFVAKDRMDYARRKIEATLRKHSDR